MEQNMRFGLVLGWLAVLSRMHFHEILLELINYCLTKEKKPRGIRNVLSLTNLPFHEILLEFRRA